MAKITDKTVQHLKYKDKEYNLTVDNGLYLRVRPTKSKKKLNAGGKSWQFKYKHPISNKDMKISMGAYPELTLQEAKAIAAEYRKQLTLGIDPKQDLEEKLIEEQRKYDDSFKSIATEWFERKKKSVSEFHANRVWRTLEKYVLSHLGSRPIAEITRREAITILRPLEKDGKLSTIKRICQTLNQIMEFAVASDIIQANPLTKMIGAFEKHEVTHMPSIRPDMLGELLFKLESNQTIQNKTKLLILWQLHTIARPKEAARTRWTDIDLENRVWTIPAEEMKRRRIHRVPLTQSSIDILLEMKRYSENREFVFPGERNRNNHASVYTANAALKRSLGFKNELVAHGLRSIASTALHENGFDTLLIEACLSHLDQNTTRASYLRTDFLEQRKDIMCWWSEYITKSQGN
ncbi:tyrosine-type recombinase/integrase [Vibrio sp. S11_S32]|uniref:tyrosine-type recombinase/integrase n=1 Tax=Vibrio sp. S11_S32 TaxID=2720225 RepID=UPI00188C8840|nr:tyrosine-type recombinase/integrase [Vibrio sp. S11_S32]MBD1576645.1 tyrosine-type recombinase/integrase [Vibrio sp. S11_S32]